MLGQTWNYWHTKFERVWSFLFRDIDTSVPLLVSGLLLTSTVYDHDLQLMELYTEIDIKCREYM